MYTKFRKLLLYYKFSTAIYIIKKWLIPLTQFKLNCNEIKNVWQSKVKISTIMTIILNSHNILIRLVVSSKCLDTVLIIKKLQIVL